MATPFETFVNTELPKRISSNDDPLLVTAGKVPVSTGVGLEVELKDPEEIGLYGKSAYDLAVEDGFEGTQEEWLESLKGDKGNTGDEGPQGLSAYEVAVEEGYDGTVEQWLTTLKGQSAYQAWLELGNTGNEQAFIDSLKGRDGTPINVIATVSQEDFDDIVAQGDSKPSDAYFVGEYMYVWNGESWIRSNSLMGPEGKGLNYLGTWPDGIDLPLDENYKAGDTYIWRKSLWTLSETPTRAWIDIGVPGPAGKSAYDIWLEAGNTGTVEDFLNSLIGKSAYQTWLTRPGNAGKTEAEFIASLKGDKGDTGDRGMSAYQVWIDAGNVGSVDDYIASLKGEKGEAAQAFTVVGKEATPATLPTPGNAAEAYLVGDENFLYVWIEEDSEYQNFGKLVGDSAYQIWLAAGNSGTQAQFLQSLIGKSAYQIAVDGGFDGTEAQWLESLKGTNGENGQSTYQLWLDQGNTGSEAQFLASLKGQDGTNGTNGKNLQVLGTQPSAAAIQALPNPEDQDAYVDNETGDLWCYTVDTWTNLGPFRGASAYLIWLQQGNTGSINDYLESLKGQDGTNGTNGQSTYELWLAEGNEGTEAQFLASLKGTNGSNGASAYQVWLNQGNVGTEAQFLASLEGMSAYEVWVIQPGNEGKSEDDFFKSLVGVGIKPKGTVPDEAALDELADPQEGDAYTTDDTGHLFVYSANQWVDLGQWRGDQGIEGIQGPQGVGINISGEVETLAELPDASTLQPGDAWYVLETHKLYQVNDAGVYGPGINIQGGDGPEGPEGPQGAPGTSITIMGSFSNEVDLRAAHPTGNAGEGYLIGPDLWLYGVNPETSETDWYNAGPVRGPQGPQGLRGLTGLRGIQGLTGERGSLWLLLPPGISVPPNNFGRAGDWAVNETFDTFYRDESDVWQQIGRLVAGDVNSPLLNQGRVVRLGNQWVPESIGAVPNAVEGQTYVRVGITDGKTEWLAIDIPQDTVPEVPAETTIPQARTSAGWVATAPGTAGLTANRSYSIMNNQWTLNGVQAAPPSQAGVALCYQVNAQGVGSWVTPTFDVYSLRQDTSAKTASFTPDFSQQQTFRISSASAVTVTLNSYTAARTLLAVFVVEGSTNKVAFSAGTGSPTLGFNNSVAPSEIEYGATQTVITAFWNGFGTWIISKGPSY